MSGEHDDPGREHAGSQYFGFSGREGARLGGLLAVVAALHVLGWGLFLRYSGDFGPVYAGAGALAYGFGLRHAFDADHISAIDDTTRVMLQRGGHPMGVGFFFALGHSTVVFALSLGLALAARTAHANLEGWQAFGGTVGGLVSGTFLWIVGVLNLVVFVGIWRTYQKMKRGSHDARHLEELLAQRGFMNRILGRRFRNLISASWHMYPVGILFGLGFDTATEIGLLAIIAGAAGTGSRAGGEALPILGIVALPMLFAAGMALMDTLDGAFMSKAYHWALSTPLRKVYYNLTTTGLSVFVALAIGTIQYLKVVSQRLGLEHPFFVWLGALDFETLGYAMVALFLLAWLTSVALFKLRRVEERWGMAADE